MELIIFFFVVFIIGFIGAVVADAKGRDARKWFGLSVLFGPVALVILICLDSIKPQEPAPVSDVEWNTAIDPSKGPKSRVPNRFK